MTRGHSTFNASIAGEAAGGQTWSWQGKVTALSVADALSTAMRQSYHALTNGRAVYGKPGVGCDGPYVVRTIKLGRIDKIE